MLKNRLHIFIFLFIAFTSISMAQTGKITEEETISGIRIPMPFGDHMVLQCGKPLKISGIADVGEIVTVRIAGQEKTARTMADGSWNLTLAPMNAGGPYCMDIETGKGIISYKDVLIGEVWLCSGQSNMAFMLKEAATANIDIPEANNSKIRFLNMKPRWQTYAVEWNSSVADSIADFQYYKEARWTECTSETVADFSAIAYYFGKLLSDSLDIPVGLICNAVGGSPCESWIDQDSFDQEYPGVSANWTQEEMIQEWVRERALLNMNAFPGKYGHHPYEPAYLFSAGIKPLSAYPIKGVIWYQGESNAQNTKTYETLFPMLVDSWRKNWNDNQLPFYYVQLSGIDRSGWPEFRDLQRHLFQRINHTGMAVSSDKGDSLDVHPKYKKEIGERLARWALNETYGMNITPSGPLFKSVEFQNSTAIITFEYASGLKTPDGQPLQTFEIAGIDHIYHPAQAEIIGEQVKVWSAFVPEPKSVRYGWQPFTRANLVNEDDLPASTFNTGFSPGDIGWKSLPAYPVEKGVSAPFIGVHHDMLIVGGGCNFPDIPASEGGSKQFYDQLFVLNIRSGINIKEWKSVGKLPEPVAYGASVSTDRGIVCIGGINSVSSLTKVILIRWNEGTQKPEFIQWPELPVGIDNAGATQIGNCIYLLGGNQNSIPSSDMYCLDMDHLQDGWKKLSPFPGPGRLQPAVTSLDNRIFIAGGYHPSLKGEKPELFSDILTYDRISGAWADSIVLRPEENQQKYCMVGGTAFQFDKNTIGYVGGVDYDRFFSALERESQIKKGPNDIRSAQLKKEAYDYMTQDPEWYQFNPDWMLLDPDQDTWQHLGSFPQLTRAGAGIVFHKGILYVVCGELKPGIRTREVNCAVISNSITNEK